MQFGTESMSVLKEIGPHLLLSTQDPQSFQFPLQRLSPFTIHIINYYYDLCTCVCIFLIIVSLIFVVVVLLLCYCLLTGKPKSVVLNDIYGRLSNVHLVRANATAILSRTAPPA